MSDLEKNVIVYFLGGLMDPFEIIIVPIGVLSTVDCTLHMSAAKENVWFFFRRDVVPASQSSPKTTFSGESVTAFHYRYNFYDCTYQTPFSKDFLLGA